MALHKISFYSYFAHFTMPHSQHNSGDVSVCTGAMAAREGKRRTEGETVLR